MRDHQSSAIKRILLIAFLFLAAFVAPQDILPMSRESVVLLAIVGIIVCVAPLGQAYARRAALHRAIARELMKMRRIYHLAKHLGNGESGHRPWFTELHGHLVGYLSFFTSKEFKGYASSDEAFRKISYFIYGAPKLATNKDEALYAELLDTVADVAYTRQEIKETLGSGMGGTERSTVFLLTSIMTMLVLLGGAVTSEQRVVAGALAVAIFLMSELLARVDSAVDVILPIPQRYADNAAKLEFRHREEE